MRWEAVEKTATPSTTVRVPRRCILPLTPAAPRSGERGPDELIPGVEHTEVTQVPVEQQAAVNTSKSKAATSSAAVSPHAGLTESMAVRAALRGLAPTISSCIRRTTAMSFTL